MVPERRATLPLIAARCHLVHAVATSLVLAGLAVVPAAAQIGWRPLAFVPPQAPFTRGATVDANASGLAAAAWVEVDYATMTLGLMVARRPEPRGGWLPAERVSAGVTDAHAPQVAVADDGEVLVVWVQPEPGRGALRAARRPMNAGTWTVLEDVAPAVDGPARVVV